MPEKPSSTSAPLAVLYLPPLASHRDDELDVLARKLAVALDRQSADGACQYEVVPMARDDGSKARRVCQVRRRDSGDAEPLPLADIFMVDYRGTLMARHRGRALIWRCLLAACGTLELGRRLVLHLFDGKARVATRQEVFQTFIVLGGMSLMLAYLAILVLSGLRIASDALQRDAGPSIAQAGHGPASGGQPVAIPSATSSHLVDMGEGSRLSVPPARAGRPSPAGVVAPTVPADPAGALLASAREGVALMWERFRPWAALLLGVLVASRLFGGDRAALVSWVTRMSEEMLAFVFYLGMGDRRAEVTGMVDDHVEKLLESGHRYSRVALMGYSFGSIVALDVLFPADNIRARRLDRVDTLVTIGAPVAFIMTYWPRYFADRGGNHAALRSWVNVFSPVDVLATEFNPAPPERGEVVLHPCHGTRDSLRRGPDHEHAFREGAAESGLTWFGTVLLLGIRAHEMYWSPEDAHERNCLHLVVSDLFPSEAGPGVSNTDGPSPVPADTGVPEPGGSAR